MLTFLLSALNLIIYFPLINKKLLSLFKCKLKNFVFPLVNLIVNFFSGERKLSLISKVGPKPNIKKLFLRLSACDDALLSHQKL